MAGGEDIEGVDGCGGDSEIDLMVAASGGGKVEDGSLGGTAFTEQGDAGPGDVAFARTEIDAEGDTEDGDDSDEDNKEANDGFSFGTAEEEEERAGDDEVADDENGDRSDGTLGAGAASVWCPLMGLEIPCVVGCGTGGEEILEIVPIPRRGRFVPGVADEEAEPYGCGFLFGQGDFVGQFGEEFFGPGVGFLGYQESSPVGKIAGEGGEACAGNVSKLDVVREEDASERAQDGIVVGNLPRSDAENFATELGEVCAPSAFGRGAVIGRDGKCGRFFYFRRGPEHG